MRSFWMSVAAALVLTACGGGSNDPAPAANQAPTARIVTERTGGIHHVWTENVSSKNVGFE